MAYGLPYPVSRTDDLVQSLTSNPLVTPTASAGSDFVIGQSAAGVLIDFHSWWGPWTIENFVFTVDGNLNHPFFAHLGSLEPGMNPVASDGQPGMLRIWGSSSSGLNADFSMTPEIGFHPFRYESDLKDIGRSFGVALFRAQPVPVVADSFSITRGTLSSGGTSELAQSDNADLTVLRSPLDVQARTEFEVKSISPVALPSSFELTLEGSVFGRTEIIQTIELFDYDSGTWELVDSRVANRFTDIQASVAPTGDVSRFVDPVSLCIEARIRYQSTSPRQSFASNVDQVVWNIGG